MFEIETTVNEVKGWIWREYELVADGKPTGLKFWQLAASYWLFPGLAKKRFHKTFAKLTLLYFDYRNPI